MGLAERLKERLSKEFGIDCLEELEKELDKIDLDLGIFVNRPEGSEVNAS